MASSRHVAAYNVIRCAATQGIGDKMYSRILIRTMNIDGLGPTALSQRRRTLYSLLNISEKSHNTYDRYEQTAYEELVALLTSSTTSPCNTPTPLVAEELIESIRRVLHESDSNLGTVQIPVAAAVKTFAPIIERLLQLILEESTRQHNQVEKEAVLVLLPRLREYLSELSTRNMSDVIKELLLRASKSMHYITEQDQTDLCDIMLARWYYSDLLLLDTAGDDERDL